MPLRPDLPPLPRHMLGLKVDARGYPIPFFVDYVNGEPDFRVMDRRKWSVCVNRDRCWLCGGGLGRYRAFVLGPMCTITRTSAEPPSHVDCAMFAIKACPFLTRPLAKRPDKAMPEGAISAGVMIPRNPGVSALWVVEKRGYTTFRDQSGLLLVKVGDPHRVEYWREGRMATRDEIDESIVTGLPFLLEQCDGKDDEAALRKLIDAAKVYLPAESASSAP